MSELTWRNLGMRQVPERPGALWTPVADYLSPGKFYKICVEPEGGEDQKWTPESATACNADGNPRLDRKEGTFPLPGLNVGALIGRIGGSTADLAQDKDKVVFGVGRYCVFQVPDTLKAGPLFLGINDTSQSAAGLVGHLKVTISEAL